MRLASFNAGVPVFAVRSEVEHLTPRIPTVFEKMVLRLVQAAEGPSTLGDTTLREAFEDVLGVADAPRLLSPCIGELCALQVLIEPDGQDPIEAPLSAWQLTAQGREFWRRGLVPRRAIYEEEMHGYDPISGELSPWREGPLAKSPPDAALDSTEPDFDFGPRVAIALRRKRPAWFKVNTEIIGVQSSVVETRWRNVALQLDVNADGTLTLSATSDETFNAWLRDAQPEVVWDYLVEPALGAASAQPADGSPELNLSEAVSVSPISKMSSEELSAPLREGWSLLILAGDEPLQGITTRGTDIVDIRQVSRRPRTFGTLAQPHEGIEVQFDAPPGLPSGLRRIEILGPKATPRVWTEGTVTLYWGGEARSVQLRAELSDRRGMAAWAVMRSALHAWLDTQAPMNALPIAVWTASIETAVQQLLQQAAELGRIAWLGEAADCLANLQQRLGLSFDKLNAQSWVAALRNGCTAIVDKAPSELSLSEGIELLEALRRLPLHQPALASAVLQRVKPREHFEEVHRLRQALGDETIVLPACLFNQTARKALLLATLRGNAPTGWGLHEFQSPLQTFSDAYREARRVIAPVLLENPTQSSDAWRQALRVQPRRTLLAITDLQRAIVHVTTALDISPGVLEAPMGRLNELRRSIEASLAPPLPAGQRAVVIDTNVLLDTPDIFERMPAHDVPIISRAVIEELDGLKQARPVDEPEKQARAQRARVASRALQDSEHIVFERSRLKECAADLPPTRDNEILAVATYYSLSAVVLLSADRNLRLTAKGNGVLAQEPRDYLKNLRSPQAAPQPKRDRSDVR